jgi:hypothetical protein
MKLVDLIETPTSLRIVARDDARDDLACIVDDGGDLLEALEWQLCNGWEVVRPEECGALTDGLIMTADAERDDHGKLTRLGVVYWDSDYQVQDALEVLSTRGEVCLSRHA